MRKIVVLGKIAAVVLPTALGVFAAGCVDLTKPAAVSACSTSKTEPCTNGGKRDAASQPDDGALADATSGPDGVADRVEPTPDARIVADSVATPDVVADSGRPGNPETAAEVPVPVVLDAPRADTRTGGDTALDASAGDAAAGDAPQERLETQAPSPDAADAGLADASDTGTDVGDAAPDTANAGPDTLGADVPDALTTTITFKSGRAEGTVMNGYGWVTLGSADTVTSPTCGATSAPITSVAPCTAQTNWNSTTALCVTGTVPALSASPTAAEYAANWGLQVGVNAKDPLAAIGVAFKTVAVNVAGTPAAGLRIELHRYGDATDATYCALLSSGVPALLTSFNTKCWDGSGVAFTAADAPTIDKVGVQVSSGPAAITVTNLCMQSIVFGS